MLSICNVQLPLIYYFDGTYLHFDSTYALPLLKMFSARCATFFSETTACILSNVYHSCSCISNIVSIFGHMTILLFHGINTYHLPTYPLLLYYPTPSPTTHTRPPTLPHALSLVNNVMCVLITHEYSIVGITNILALYAFLYSKFSNAHGS